MDKENVRRGRVIYRSGKKVDEFGFETAVATGELREWGVTLDYYVSLKEGGGDVMRRDPVIRQ